MCPPLNCVTNIPVHAFCGPTIATRITCDALQHPPGSKLRTAAAAMCACIQPVSVLLEWAAASVARRAKRAMQHDGGPTPVSRLRCSQTPCSPSHGLTRGMWMCQRCELVHVVWQQAPAGNGIG
jgi:hypothetical protein